MRNGSGKDAKPLPWKMNESHITFQNQTIVNVVSTQLNSTDWDFLTAVACCVEFKVIFAKILLFYSYPLQRKHPFCKFMTHNIMLVSKCNLILKKDPWFFKTKNDVEKWYFVTKLFLPTVRKNCSSDREKLLKFEAESLEFSKNFLDH